ncbi:MAG: hypothetical protein ACI89J_003499 [Hyphomicrobiaceae bacterium]|jgi:hypothetical protein
MNTGSDGQKEAIQFSAIDSCRTPGPLTFSPCSDMRERGWAWLSSPALQLHLIHQTASGDGWVIRSHHSEKGSEQPGNPRPVLRVQLPVSSGPRWLLMYDVQVSRTPSWGVASAYGCLRRRRSVNERNRGWDEGQLSGCYGDLPFRLVLSARSGHTGCEAESSVAAYTRRSLS